MELEDKILMKDSIDGAKRKLDQALDFLARNDVDEARRRAANAAHDILNMLT